MTRRLLMMTYVLFCTKCGLIIYFAISLPFYFKLFFNFSPQVLNLLQLHIFLYSFSFSFSFSPVYFILVSMLPIVFYLLFILCNLYFLFQFNWDSLILRWSPACLCVCLCGCLSVCLLFFVMFMVICFHFLFSTSLKREIDLQHFIFVSIFNLIRRMSTKNLICP